MAAIKRRDLTPVATYRPIEVIGNRTLFKLVQVDMILARLAVNWTWSWAGHNQHPLTIEEHAGYIWMATIERSEEPARYFWREEISIWPKK